MVLYLYNNGKSKMNTGITRFNVESTLHELIDVDTEWVPLVIHSGQRGQPRSDTGNT